MMIDKGFGPRLNIQRLLMELETYITQNTSIPFTNKVIVDRNDVYDLIDNIRAKLPDELKECEKFLEKNKGHLENLKKEEQQILEKAEIERKNILDAAQKEAEKLLATSQGETRPIDAKAILETEEYCKKLLLSAEEEAKTIIGQAQENVSLAEVRAQEIIADAHRMTSQAAKESQMVIHEATVYIDELMDEFAQHIRQNIELVRQGREEIQQVMPNNRRNKERKTRP